MRNKLESDLKILKVRLALLEKKILKCHKCDEMKYLKDVRKAYVQAILSAEETLEMVKELDPALINAASRLKKAAHKPQKV